MIANTAAFQRRLFTTSSLHHGEVAERCGEDGYSYYFVQRAFLPLLERWAAVNEVSRSPVGLDEAVAAARRAGQTPIHLSFLPLEHVQLADRARNIAFPFWEYPDVPNQDVAGLPRNNWARTANRLDLILTACEFTRDAFRRAGVRTPLEVAAVPIANSYFDLAAWQPEQQVDLDCRCYLLPQAVDTSRLRVAARRIAARLGAAAALERFPIPFAASNRLEMAGVVYSTILNPFDERKNWRGILAAFVAALADRPDAMLVIKLVVSRSMQKEALHNVLHFYQRLRARHKCRVAVVADYLSDQQMVELACGSTYYVNASHAEGACLPLQDFLAAGRPGIAPRHTAMAEYIDDQVAFVVPSHSQPTHWPFDPQKRPTTSWQQIQPADLTTQIRGSFQVARHDLPRYRVMAQGGRDRIYDLAHIENVWRRLSPALDRLTDAPTAQASLCGRAA
jgi:glycosyltransferase involved in cell wall biosynthesis